MKACCQKEAQASIKKHRDVVRCDTCGKLILAYGNDEDYQKMITQLGNSKNPFETAPFGKLQLVIKDSSEPSKK